MSSFLLVAAIMAVSAAAVVAWPLLRDRQSRIVGGVAGLLVAGLAAALYPLWSNWDWHASVQTQQPSGPDIGAMVAKLEKHLREQPTDQAGWLMLGRSYLALERLKDAVDAYEHAHNLAPSGDAAVGLGEAIALRAGGDITPQADQLFEEALSLAPGNARALLYGGFAAAARGERGLARRRFETLKELNPPPQIVQMLDARIAELGPPEAGSLAAPAAPTAMGTSASPAGTSTMSGGSASAEATVNITIAPALKARLKADTPLFVFAREPGKPGPPLAAKRMTSAAIGSQIKLSSSDSMMPGRVLVSGQTVSITARVSFSGQPTPSTGDLYGELSYEVGHDGVRELVIDHVAD